MGLITYPVFASPDGWTLSDQTWLWFDTHFGNQSKLVDVGMRPLDHNERMLAAWRALIGLDDPVLHGGDIEFAKGEAEYRKSWYRVIGGLPGNTVLIPGNHDDNTKTWIRREYGWACIPAKQDQGVIIFTDLVSQKRIAISHSPLLTTMFPWDVNIHGHIHSNGYGLTCKDIVDRHGKVYICCCVEYTDYQPIRLGAVLDSVRSMWHSMTGGMLCQGDYRVVGLAKTDKALGVGLGPPDEHYQVCEVPYDGSMVPVREGVAPVSR